MSPTESSPMAFGIPLAQVIANDQAFKRRQDALKESRRDCLDLEASILRFRAEKRHFFNGDKPLLGSSSIPGAGLGSPPPGSDSQNKPMSPTFVENTGRQRRVRQPRPADHRSDPLSSSQAVVNIWNVEPCLDKDLKCCSQLGFQAQK